MEDNSIVKNYVFQDPKSRENYVLLKFESDRWNPVTNIDSEPSEIWEVVYKMQNDEPAN